MRVCSVNLRLLFLLPTLEESTIRAFPCSSSLLTTQPLSKQESYQCQENKIPRGKGHFMQVSLPWAWVMFFILRPVSGALPLPTKRLPTIYHMSFQTGIQDFPLSHFYQASNRLHTECPLQHQLLTGITTYLLPKLLETCSTGQANSLPTHAAEFSSRTACPKWAV